MYEELKKLAEASRVANHDDRGADEAFQEAFHPEVALMLIAEIDRLNGLQPSLPPRPPEGEGLPRFGLRWNGPSNPLAVSMDDGYWTPWHLADQLKAENEALRNVAIELRRWAMCENLHHVKADQHEHDQPCKVLARIDAAMSKDATK